MFNLFKPKIKADGFIKYYGLQELWISAFTEEQREEVRQRYSMGLASDGNNIDTGNFSHCGASKSSFITSLAEAISDITAKGKLLKMALAEMENDVIDNHFVLMKIANEYKSMIKVDASYYPDQIDVLARDCALYDQFAIDYMKLDYVEHEEELPNYPAFRELAIAYERTGEIQKAIGISNLAIKMKVNEKTSFENRIAKLIKKL